MIEIRELESKDVAGIAELEKICFSDPWSESSIASELHNPLSCWLVAVEENRVVGYVGSQTVLDGSDMMNIAVAPDFRRMGIAQALVSKLISLLKKRNSRCLILEVRVSNLPAITLYEKNGFTQIGRRRNYYHNPKEDALILRKEWDL